MTLPLDKRDLDHILEHATPQFVELSEGRLFLTGATGLFGSWLLESIAHAQLELSLKFDVQFLSRDPDRFLAQHPFLKTIHRLSGLRGDIRSFTVPDGSAFTHMIHGAATSAHETFAGEPASRKYDTIVAGTRNALDVATQTGVTKFLYLSSGAVYDTSGLDPRRPVSEDFLGAPNPLKAGSSLGLAKRAAEHFCSLWALEKPSRSLKIARCFSFIGPRIPMDIHYAIGNFLADGLKGKDIVIRGSGTEVRSYLYLGDLVVWLTKALAFHDRLNVYNVGSMEAVSLAELARRVAAATSPSIKVRVLGENAPQTSASPYYVPATDRINQLLNVKQWVNLDSSIERTALYIRRACAS